MPAMCPQVILYVWVVSSMWWLMFVYDCLWLLLFMIVIEGSGWDFIVGVSATVSLSGSNMIFSWKGGMISWLKLSSKALFEKQRRWVAGATSARIAWELMCSSFKSTQSSLASLTRVNLHVPNCAYLSKPKDDRIVEWLGEQIVLPAPRNCLPGVSMLTWSPTSEKLRCCSKCKSARGLNTCNYE